MHTPLAYFAYGSNMNAARMRRRGVRFRHLHAARLRGFRLRFNKIWTCDPNRGAANVERFSGANVEGVLYHLVDRHAVSVLDGVEGYPIQYRRRSVTVAWPGGFVTAMTYVASPERICNTLRPAREYLAHLIAARELLSDEYLARLERTPTAD